MPSFKMTLTEPSYEGYIAMSTGCFRSNYNLVVSKSIIEPLGKVLPSSSFNSESPVVFILKVLNGLYSYTRLPF